ncbi:hypothetical protein BDE02_14G036900 [Populus trichocarpa]|nr:hypothetical protein BDE02_14G036900 [Populus trichocarpa]
MKAELPQMKEKRSANSYTLMLAVGGGQNRSSQEYWFLEECLDFQFYEALGRKKTMERLQSCRDAYPERPSSA